ncbi:MAG TPA: hypothetical protein PKE07_08055 [Lacibacter sp.]|nr:hypothetical protein [Lacibacter sp.]HMO89859.1 hypothetical protein [Lacibacter sp.]
MNGKSFYDLIDLVTKSNHFLSESRADTIELIRLLEMDRIPAVAQLLAHPETLKQMTSEEVVALLKKALAEYRGIQVQSKNKEKPIEAYGRIWDAQKRFVKDSFHAVILLKLLGKLNKG